MSFSAEKAQNQANSMYTRVLSKIWETEDQTGQPISGVQRRVSRLPVTDKERRPVIVVEHMDVKAHTEPTKVVAQRMPDGLLRLALVALEDTGPYGMPLSVPSDYGEPIQKSRKPRFSAVGVDIAPGTEPQMVAEQADGAWDNLDGIRVTDAVRFAGAVTRAITADNKQVEVIPQLPEGDLSASFKS